MEVIPPTAENYLQMMCGQLLIQIAALQAELAALRASVTASAPNGDGPLPRAGAAREVVP